MAEITRIEKINGQNYQSWKYNMKLLLMERGLWGFTQQGQETQPDENAAATVRNAFRLRSDIGKNRMTIDTMITNLSL